MASTHTRVFQATLKERYCLNEGSERETFHLVVDLQNSGIEYCVGDCLGIYPENDSTLVESTLQFLKANGNEIIEDRRGTTYPLRIFLRSHANLLRLPQGSLWSAADFCKKLAPQLPRFYSIASSQKVVGDEAHLTVGLIDGICSHYLCKHLPIGQPILPVFHHISKNFCLPPESFDKPIIMIGPGTGIAPFRGFMQERILQKSSAKNWLFFGERHSTRDFYYKEDWHKWIVEGKLELNCAFSRDQEHKIYVQHLMLQQSTKFWEWLKNGAFLFVCGNASKMAKDVDKILHQIIEQEGGLSSPEVKHYVKDLKKEGRYQRDVY